MALSIAEKALAAVLGIETARPGTTGTATRKAIMAGGRAILAGTITVAPPVARAVGRTAVANPYLAAGILGTAAYQGGYLDPAIQRAQEESFRAQENLRRIAMESPIQRGYEMAGRPTFGEAVERLVPIAKKRSVSNFNKAMKAGMAAVKRSKSNGKPGTMLSPKKTFARIAKVAKAMKSGKKVSSKGETGIIKRNIKRYIG
jgi:hypothetical protein